MPRRQQNLICFHSYTTVVGYFQPSEDLLEFSGGRMPVSDCLLSVLAALEVTGDFASFWLLRMLLFNGDTGVVSVILLRWLLQFHTTNEDTRTSVKVW